MRHTQESDMTTGHAHTCLTCGTVIETGNFDCENDRDHDFRNCDDCAAREAETDVANGRA